VIVDGSPSAGPVAAAAPFIRALREAGWDAEPLDAAEVDGETARSSKQPSSRVIALFGEGRAGDGKGYGDAARAAVERAARRAPGALLMQFGHPRLIRDLPAGPPIATAWGGESAMQEAAARWLTSGG
jgi:hypothetical protein